MSTIRIQTPIPGPNSRALRARRDAAVPQGALQVTPLFVERAEGATVTDVDGNVFLDFAGGIGTLNVGHAHPRVVAAVVRQAERFLHTCFHCEMYESYVAVAEKLNDLTPGAFPKMTLLVNSGAEAVENAVKIARYYTHRPAVVAFEHGFAGRTLLTMSLSSKVMPYKYGFGPFAPEVYRLPYPYAYRDGGVEGWKDGRPGGEAAFADRAIAQMHEFFQTHVDPRQVACVVMELVLGEGGFVVAPPAYVAALVKFCQANGILFVADEIQTGFGRTGRMFAAEHYALEPDLITTAKSLAAGLPLAAVTGRSEIMNSVHVGGLGGTYSGNPVACAAALAVIEAMETQQLPARAAALGATLRARLLDWQQRQPLVGEVRGLGAMLALEFVTDRRTKEPAKDYTRQLVQRCYEHGVITISAGTHGNVLRFLVPLVITDAQLAEGLDVIEREVLG